MTGFLPTLKKELFSYLVNPLGYVILLLLYLLRGQEVRSMVLLASRLPFGRDEFQSSYLLTGSTSLFLILVPPILTMRCFAEERRSGSLEVLMTAPVSDLGVVLGKWGAAFAFFVVLWLPSMPILWLLEGESYTGADLFTGPVLSSYLGMFLVGAMFLAIGCFTSSLTDNQLLASLSGMVIIYALLTAPTPLLQLIENARVEGVDDPGIWSSSVRFLTDNVFEPLLQQAFVSDHLARWFGRGLLNSGQIAFYLAGTGAFLFLTMKSLESRRIA